MAEQRRFCPVCGASVANTGDSFCERCGAPLASATPVAPNLPTVTPTQGSGCLRKSLIGFGVLIGLFALVVIWGSYLNATNPRTPTPQGQVAVAATLKPTATAVPPTATPSPSDQLAGVARERFGNYLREVGLTQRTAVVSYSLGAQWDEAMTVRTASFDLCQLAPKVFILPGVDLLILTAYTEFTDAYGKTTSAVATSFSISYVTASKINWPGFDRRNLPVVLKGPGDGLKIHPALQPAWIAYVTGR